MAARDARVALEEAGASPPAAGWLAAGWLARRQVRGGWRLLLAVALAMIVAVTLLATVPLFSGVLATLQLQGIVNGEPPNGRNVEIDLTTYQTSAAFFHGADDAVRTLGRRYLNFITAPHVTHGFVSEPLGLAQVGDRPYNVYTLAAPQITLEGYDFAVTRGHMRLIAGSFPGASPPGADGAPQALITRQMADQEGVGVGDLITGTRLTYPHDVDLVRVVGIWAPTDA
ncbi:MAG TPA: hypothetical protein VGR57_19740, partial [Ktedonobacterales bacterium]|nr:hypothetical protein [Ktedonobacterales bacterium]